MDEKTAAERLQKQYKNQNEFIKNNYDRINLTTPAGTKERIKSVIGSAASVNGWINGIIEKELKRAEKKAAADQDKTTE